MSLQRTQAADCGFTELVVEAWESVTVQCIARAHLTSLTRRTSAHTHLPLILDGSNDRGVGPPVSGTRGDDVPIAQVEAAILEKICVLRGVGEWVSGPHTGQARCAIGVTQLAFLRQSLVWSWK